MADDSTLELAGEVGRGFADALSEKVTSAIDGFPASNPDQKAAIARITADSIYDWAEEEERGDG